MRAQHGRIALDRRPVVARPVEELEHGDELAEPISVRHGVDGARGAEDLRAVRPEVDDHRRDRHDVDEADVVRHATRSWGESRDELAQRHDAVADERGAVRHDVVRRDGRRSALDEDRVQRAERADELVAERGAQRERGHDVRREELHDLAANQRRRRVDVPAVLHRATGLEAGDEDRHGHGHADLGEDEAEHTKGRRQACEVDEPVLPVVRDAARRDIAEEAAIRRPVLPRHARLEEPTRREALEDAERRPPREERVRGARCVPTKEDLDDHLHHGGHEHLLGGDVARRPRKRRRAVARGGGVRVLDRVLDHLLVVARRLGGRWLGCDGRHDATPVG